MRAPKVDERCALWPREMRALWDEASVSQDHDLTRVAIQARENQANHGRADQLALMEAQNQLALTRQIGNYIAFHRF